MAQTITGWQPCWPGSGISIPEEMSVVSEGHKLLWEMLEKSGAALDKKLHLHNLKIRKTNQSLWKILFSFYI
jgi:hypothetical protein